MHDNVVSLQIILIFFIVGILLDWALTARRVDELDHAEGANIGLLFFISCLRLNHKDIVMEFAASFIW